MNIAANIGIVAFSITTGLCIGKLLFGIGGPVRWIAALGAVSLACLWACIHQIT